MVHGRKRVLRGWMAVNVILVLAVDPQAADAVGHAALTRVESLPVVNLAAKKEVSFARTNASRLSFFTHCLWSNVLSFVWTSSVCLYRAMTLDFGLGKMASCWVRRKGCRPTRGRVVISPSLCPPPPTRLWADLRASVLGAKGRKRARLRSPLTTMSTTMSCWH